MAPRQRVAALLLVLATICWGGTVRAAQLFIGPPTGGHCQSLGGFWVTGTNSCLLFSATVTANDQLFIFGGSTLQIAHSFLNEGLVENDGKIINQGTIWNHGQIFSDEMFVNGFLVNETDGFFRVEPGGECRGTPGSNLVNYGEFLNLGELILDVDESIPAASGFFNVGSMTNTHTVFGGATLTHSGSLLYNEGSLDNTVGVIRNTTVENRGLVEGGLIDDIGGASAFVTNQAAGTIDGAVITKVSVDNFGVLDNHTLGSGTITNGEGALIRASGGQAFLVFNDGVIDILGDFELFNNFTNNADGILVNRGNMLSHTHLINHGLFENRGPWVNDGASPGQGVIDNFGTLLNVSSISSCSRFGDEEQINNFGLLSNGGTISGCGATNEGVWYQCSLSELPGGDPVIPVADVDADAVCAPVDCDDRDSGSWAVATEVKELSIEPGEHAHLFNWGAAHYFGGEMLYDVVASEAADDFLGMGSCVAIEVPGSQLEDPTPNLPDSLLYFLVRVNGCGGGNTGVDSAGVPRATAPCP